VSARLALLAAGVLACACGGGGLRRFPLREPLQEDPDQRPFAPMPEEYFSPFGWDGADNLLFRPVSQFFKVDPGGEAVNVNALDEVPDSSWFVNRLSRGNLSPEEVARGPCDRTPELPWKVTQAKPDGANPGFFIQDARGDRYLLKFDQPEQPERATAADVIGARIYHAAGYHVACAQVVLFDADALVAPPAAPGADTSDPRKVVTPQRVAAVLARAPRTAQGLYRANASLYVEGTPIGPWRYEGVRDDDPNDVVPHQDRRELRGSKLLAAWINHFDAREQNTLASFIQPKGKEGGGYVRHYMLDFGDTLGSMWSWDGISRRLGHAHYFDFAEVGRDFVTLGIPRRPWDRAQLGPAGKPLGYFDVERFEPEHWKPGYPNPAFAHMTEQDAAWMARILARFGDAHVKALVETGRLENPVVRAELERILLGRRDALLARYLESRSPLTLPRVVARDGGAQLCLEDLVVTAHRAEPAARRYRAQAWAGESLRALPAPQARGSADAAQDVCVSLPGELGGSEGKPAYLVVDLEAGAAPPVRVHLYHLGAERFRVVGLERPERADAPKR
jgi:hypothetical protein